MNKRYKLSLQVLVVSSLLTSVSALAADAGTFYLGYGIGRTMTDYSSSNCQSDAQSALPVPADFSCSTTTSDTGMKLLGGYNISPMFAVEAAYSNLGQLKLVASSASAGFTVNLKQKTTAFNVDAVGNFDMGNNITLSGKLGVYSANQTASDDAGDDNTTQSSTGLDFGVRGGYAFTKNFAGRLEYERFNNVGKTDFTTNNAAPSEKATISMFSAALVYNF